jgi:hypothetical protein
MALIVSFSFISELHLRLGCTKWICTENGTTLCKLGRSVLLVIIMEQGHCIFRPKINIFGQALLAEIFKHVFISFANYQHKHSL